jgi:hypothetical protein
MTRLRWSAGDARGVAHAHVSGRTLCHAPAIGERYAWPMLAHCPDCFRAAEALRPITSGSLGTPGLSFHARPAIAGSPGGPAAREHLEPEP